MVAKLIALCMALFLVGGIAGAADRGVGPSTASVELVDTPADLVVPHEPEVVRPLRHGERIEMPPVTKLITYAFAPRMDRPPRN